MARQKGANNFAGTLEVIAAAPLDARSIVPTKADLTASANFPYPYVGMEVYVTAENKKYRLTANDPTTLSNWEEVGAGGTGGGHEIEDPEGTALTQRDTLQFGGDLEVSDDDENEKTVVAPHELTAAELTEIVTPLPSVPVNMPILFDESGAEYQVGWYKYANGTKKPVYEKIVMGYLPSSAKTESYAHNINNVDEFVRIEGIVLWRDNASTTMPVINTTSKATLIFIPSVNSESVLITVDSDRSTVKFIVTLQYTKTTDTPT